MTCSACGEANRDHARFCFSCGVRLAARCATCDAELLEAARFCDECGAPTVAATPDTATSSARKTVTIVFADLQGSTALQERMDPESARNVMSRYYDTMRTVVESRGGQVVKFVGDGVMAVFGVPEVAEDDAWRALDAAAAMVAAVQTLIGDLALPADAQLVMRAGVNTGEVVVAEDDADVVGDVVNVASRLEGAAPPNGVLVGDTTWRLTRERAAFGDRQIVPVKGRTEPVEARALLERSVAIGDAPLGTSFVGRDPELEELRAAFERAASTNTVQLAAIIGSPGVGKSRLVRELHAELADRATLLAARCDATAGAAFAPVVDVVRAAAEVAGGMDALLANEPEQRAVASALATLIEQGRSTSPEETFWAVRRALVGLAAATDRPVVIMLDDLHWAEPLLLDLVEHLTEWLRGMPLLLVIAARPELREMRPALVETGGRAAAVIALEGLDDGATTRLARELLGTGSGALPVMLIARVVAATAGNPLFVRELLRMLVDDGVLLQAEDGWRLTIDAALVDVPPTISSLLEARIDRLRVEERLVLERAAVIGAEVYRGLLVELLPASVRRDLPATLESLRRKELLEPAGTYWVDEPVLRFHHILIRDAAYRRLLKEARAELHERVATWLTDKIGTGREHDEIVGYHLEQAFHNRSALGRVDDATRLLATDAADRLGRAGRRALDHDDLPTAASLAERALACLAADDPARGELLVARCEALLGSGDVTIASTAIDVLAELAPESERLNAWATCFDAQRTTMRGGSLDGLEDRLASAAETLQSLGDASGAAKAHRVHASVLARLGRIGDCEAALDRALTAARAAGDHRQITNVLAAAPSAALWGPSPVARAGGRCLDVVRLLRITTGSPEVEAISIRCQAILEALRGRFDAARSMLAAARRILEERGVGHALLDLDVAHGLVELVAGESAEADRFLERASAGLHALGAEADAHRAIALRARAAFAMGDVDRALDLAEQCTTAEQDLTTAVAAWTVKAQVLAARGDGNEALELAHATVDLAAHTDLLVDHADACAALSAVLAQNGDAAGAQDALRRARALYEQKGATALADRLGVDSHADEEPATAAASMVRRLSNRATTDFEAIMRAVIDGTFDPAQTIPPDYTFEDRRPGLQIEVSGDESALTQLQVVADMGVDSMDLETVAIRGDYCALVKAAFGVGGAIVEPLIVASRRPDETAPRSVIFGTDALADALQELDDEYFAGEGAALPPIAKVASQLSHAFNRRDWDALRDGYAADIESVDHRLASLGETRGVDAVLDRHRGFAEVMPDGVHVVRRFVSCTSDAVIIEERGVSSSAFRMDRLTVMRMRDGRVTRAEMFDIDDLASADALVRSWPSPNRLDNAGMRALIVGCEVLTRGALDEALAHVTENVVLDDRRSGLQNAVSSDLWATIAESLDGVLTPTPLAIRGEHLALAKMSFADRATGFGQDSLVLTEADERGRTAANVIFDADNLVEAIAELNRRHRLSMPPAVAETMATLDRLSLALNAGDVAGFEALITPDFRITDRQVLGYGSLDLAGTLASIDAVNTPGHVLFAEELLAFDEHGCVGRTRELERNMSGGDVEQTMVMLLFVRDGRCALVEYFSPEHADVALARYAELTRGASSDRLGNQASTAHARWIEAFVERRWDDIAAMQAEGDLYVDHRSIVGGETALGVAETGEMLKGMAGIGVTAITSEVVAVRDERLALTRDVYKGNRYETEVLQVTEINESGLFTLGAVFDPDDLEGAVALLDERWDLLLDDECRAIRQLGAHMSEMLYTGDAVGLRACFASDAMMIDHRPTSYGTLNVDAYVDASMTVNDVVASAFEYLEIAVIEPHGMAFRYRTIGTDHTGNSLEWEMAAVLTVVDGLIAHAEGYEATDYHLAVQRLEELRPLPLENAATRSVYEAIEAIGRGAFDTIEAAAIEGFHYEDRRKGLRHEFDGRDTLGDVWRWMENATYRSAPVAIRGNRLALMRMSYTEHESGFGGSALIINEVRDDGVGTANLIFDDDDLDAAMAELDRRHVAMFDNAAIRSVYATTDAITRGDIDVAAAASEGVLHEDRRKGLRNDFEGRDTLGAQVEAMEGGRFEIEPIAVRGDRLSLTRVTHYSAGSEFAVTTLLISEVDAGGATLANIVFDEDDVDTAVAELDRRYAGGEGAPSSPTSPG
jgi:class 3 adenylate cyclase/tetratricopeptide (TPR) repeat protein/type II secretory pathway predicted ATPase ExeA